MKLNLNNEWDNYKLTYGQKVKFEGEEVTVIGIGHGPLLEGRVKIDTNEGVRIVDVRELEV